MDALNSGPSLFTNVIWEHKKASMGPRTANINGVSPFQAGQSFFLDSLQAWPRAIPLTMARFQKILFVGFATAIQPVFSFFSLNVSGPDWDYTITDLANTTSEACQTAYSAQIDCDDTLLGLVASMRPAFDPTSDDLDRTCTTTCSDSLVSYIENVIEACDEPGDLANEAVTSNTVAAKDPVALVGQIFQYNLVQNCKKNE